jgi:hypothetical protein
MATPSDARGWLREIDALASGWDEGGAIGPREGLSWESVARLAMDYARAAAHLLPPTASPETPPDGVKCLCCTVRPATRYARDENDVGFAFCDSCRLEEESAAAAVALPGYERGAGAGRGDQAVTPSLWRRALCRVLVQRVRRED